MPDRAERRRQQRAGRRQPGDDPKIGAAARLLERTGATELQVRYSDDQQPIVWFAVARYRTSPDGRPSPPSKERNEPGQDG